MRESGMGAIASRLIRRYRLFRYAWGAISPGGIRSEMRNHSHWIPSSVHGRREQVQGNIAIFGRPVSSGQARAAFSD